MRDRLKAVGDQDRTAIVVLGCRVGSAALAARIRRAIALYASFPRLVVACGGRRWPGGVEADAIAAELLANAVRKEDIVVERRSMTTRENAEEARGELTRRRIDRVVLVTSRFHLPRAVRTFEDAGFDVAESPLLALEGSRGKRAWLSARERVSYRLQRLLA